MFTLLLPNGYVSNKKLDGKSIHSQVIWKTKWRQQQKGRESERFWRKFNQAEMENPAKKLFLLHLLLYSLSSILTVDSMVEWCLRELSCRFHHHHPSPEWIHRNKIYISLNLIASVFLVSLMFSGYEFRTESCHPSWIYSISKSTVEIQIYAPWMAGKIEQRKKGGVKTEIANATEKIFNFFCCCRKVYFEKLVVGAQIWHDSSQI